MPRCSPLDTAGPQIATFPVSRALQVARGVGGVVSARAGRRARACASVVGLWLFALTGPAPMSRPAGGAEPRTDEAPTLALRTLLREDAPLAERLAAAAPLLAADVLPSPGLVLRTAAALAREAPLPAAWLVRVSLSAGGATRAERAAARSLLDTARVESAADGSTTLPARSIAERAALAAASFLLGDRRPATAAELLAASPRPAVVRAILHDELGYAHELLGTRPFVELGPREAESALSAWLPALSALDLAAADDVEEMDEGLRLLLGPLRESALPVLVGELRGAALRGESAGRTPRAMRAALALGRMGDARARPYLERAFDGDDGWLRTIAASALGDLGDPGAAPVLAWRLAEMSDSFRNRDAWNYPGPNATPVAAEDWASTDYMATDAAAAEALLRLGVPRAARWIVERQLEPRSLRFRIRVLQDAIDALAIHLPEAPVAAFEPDGGLPQRAAAYEGLVGWWHEVGGQPRLARPLLDESHPHFVAAARRMAQHLREDDARRFIIAKGAIAILGPPMTPALLEALERAERPVARSEIALALGLVEDPRAVPALLSLANDPRRMVRARALTALRPYARSGGATIDALLRALETGSEDERMAALESLVSAPRSRRVRVALAAVAQEDWGQSPAGLAARLVQEGPAVAMPSLDALLRAPGFETRLAAWDRVRVALSLSPLVFDPRRAPTGSDGPPAIEATLLEQAWAALPVEAGS